MNKEKMALTVKHDASVVGTSLNRPWSLVLGPWFKQQTTSNPPHVSLLCPLFGGSLLCPLFDASNPGHRSDPKNRGRKSDT